VCRNRQGNGGAIVGIAARSARTSGLSRFREISAAEDFRASGLKSRILLTRHGELHSRVKGFVLRAPANTPLLIHLNHNVISAIDIERLAGDKAGSIVREKGGGDANIINAHKATRRGL
jgi:hypothetical protein